MSRLLLVTLLLCAASLPAASSEVFTITFDLSGPGDGNPLNFDGTQTFNGDMFEQTLTLTTNSGERMVSTGSGLALEPGATFFRFQPTVPTSGVVQPTVTFLGFQSVSVTENGDTFTLTSPSSGLALTSTQDLGSPIVEFTEIAGSLPTAFTLTPNAGFVFVTSAVAKYELATAVPEPATAMGLLAVFGVGLLRNRKRRSEDRQSHN